MRFNVNASLETGVICDLITIYPREDKIEVGWRFDTDQAARKTSITASTSYNARNLEELTLQLARAVVKAVKDVANIDKNAADITGDFWEAENI